MAEQQIRTVLGHLSLCGGVWIGDAGRDAVSSPPLGAKRRNAVLRW